MACIFLFNVWILLVWAVRDSELNNIDNSDQTESRLSCGLLVLGDYRSDITVKVNICRSCRELSFVGVVFLLTLPSTTTGEGRSDQRLRFVTLVCFKVQTVIVPADGNLI